MVKNITCLAIIIFITLGYKNISNGKDIMSHEKHGMLCRAFSTAEKSDPDSETDEYKKLEEELKKLVDEMKKLEKEVKDKLRKEILPRIRKEIEKLRKKLREFPKKDKAPKDDEWIRT